jgi:hypothetical protein
VGHALRQVGSTRNAQVLLKVTAPGRLTVCVVMCVYAYVCVSVGNFKYGFSITLQLFSRSYRQIPPYGRFLQHVRIPNAFRTVLHQEFFMKCLIDSLLKLRKSHIYYYIRIKHFVLCCL